MSDIAIRVEKLGKRYRIGHRQENYKTLRDSLANAASRFARRVKSVIKGRHSLTAHHGSADTIWALKDVSFDVERVNRRERVTGSEID